MDDESEFLPLFGEEREKLGAYFAAGRSDDDEVGLKIDSHS